MSRGIRGGRVGGFTLIEVVVSTAVFATVIVAVIGLLAPISRRVDDVSSADLAARLAGTIETELRRVGFDWARTNIPSPLSAPIFLVAAADGSRIRLESGGDADAALNIASPGIAERDRYFRIGVKQSTPFVDGTHGTMTITAEVMWPYRVPVGPASSTAVARFVDGGDPSAEPPETERRTVVFFFAIHP